MLDIAIAVVILVVIILGFWFTRNVRGASPVDRLDNVYSSNMDEFNPYDGPEQKRRGTAPGHD